VLDLLSYKPMCVYPSRDSNPHPADLESAGSAVGLHGQVGVEVTAQSAVWDMCVVTSFDISTPQIATQDSNLDSPGSEPGMLPITPVANGAPSRPGSRPGATYLLLQWHVYRCGVLIKQWIVSTAHVTRPVTDSNRHLPP
jgi:hypothetical protein